MNSVVFQAVSTAGLGPMLKGYGVIASIGRRDAEARFWWDHSGHLVAELSANTEVDSSRNGICTAMEAAIRDFAVECTALLDIAKLWNEKKLRARRTERQARLEQLVDSLRTEAALAAAAISPHLQTAHPLLGSFGKYGARPEANYLNVVAKVPAKAEGLQGVLFGEGPPLKKSDLRAGGSLFADAIKRYATGSSWVHEKDAPVSYWDFALAICGALLLRGAARSFRGSRRSYSSFPFVFRGSPMKASGKLFIVDEIFLPTWSEDRPRTLAELRMQIRQFQARVGGGELAATAADFRRAVQGRGVAGGFDRFYRFVLERRKPGQRQPAVQAVARGATVVGEGAMDLRVLLARLDESGWLDQIEQPHIPTKKKDEQLLLAAREVHDAIHACSDDPTEERHVAVLSALSKANRLLLKRTETTRARPLAPLPSRQWERVLADVVEELPEARVARALASIGWAGWDPQTRQWRRGQPWPIACQILPVQYKPARQVVCFVPDPPPSARVPWRGMRPEHEFARVFWRRWLDAAHQEEGDSLPYGATRFAPLEDVLMLLRGELDLREVHRYSSAFLALDWSRPAPASPRPAPRRPAPTTYAVLRLWLDAGIHPPEGSSPGRDGAVAQSLIRADSPAILSACRAAVARLRVVGLPPRRSESEDRRVGQAVARAAPICTRDEARRMPLAVLVPISPFDTEQLGRRLWVPASEDELVTEASHAEA